MRKVLAFAERKKASEDFRKETACKVGNGILFKFVTFSVRTDYILLTYTNFPFKRRGNDIVTAGENNKFFIEYMKKEVGAGSRFPEISLIFVLFCFLTQNFFGCKPRTRKLSRKPYSVIIMPFHAILFLRKSNRETNFHKKDL